VTPQPSSGPEKFGGPYVLAHSPNNRAEYSLRISSAILVCDRRTSSANGAVGRHDRPRGNEACYGRVVVTVEGAQVDGAYGPASWAAPTGTNAARCCNVY